MEQQWQFANLSEDEIKKLKDMEQKYNSDVSDGVYLIAFKK